MIQSLKIPIKLIDLNTYINKERGNRYAAASIKKRLTEDIYWIIKSQKIQPFNKPVRIKFKWYVPSRRCDPDNFSFGKKFVLDALQLAGILKKDNLMWVLGFDGDDFVVSNEREGVDLTINDENNEAKTS